MTLPLLVSVPHAGLRVPAEVEPLCALTPAEVADDGDGGADEIYAFEKEVGAFVTTDVARAIVDMNRARDNRKADGVVKTHTCWDVEVWKRPLSGAEIRDRGPPRRLPRAIPPATDRVGDGPPVGPGRRLPHDGGRGAAARA